MVSKDLTANTTAQTVFTVPLAKLGRITRIEIDNASANAVTFTISDTFLPTASANNPNPSNVTETRKVITAPANTHMDIRSESIDILGSATVTASATDTSVHISIEYEML